MAEAHEFLKCAHEPVQLAHAHGAAQDLLLLSFYKNKTYRINSGHVLNALGILFSDTSPISFTQR